jgi:hypothetical protein
MLLIPNSFQGLEKLDLKYDGYVIHDYYTLHYTIMAFMRS